MLAHVVAPIGLHLFNLYVMWPKLFTWPLVVHGLAACAAVTRARHKREAGLFVPLQEHAKFTFRK